ncbi:MAG: helix-turn-helix domain-containing protein [Blautia sp.]
MKPIKQMYHSMLSDGGFFLDHEHRQPYNEFTCYTLQADKGQGHFWVYFYENMFEITIRDFLFFDDFMLECPEPEFLSVTYYTSVSGEEFHPYCQLSPNSLQAQIGHTDKIYQAIYHKNIPLKSISFTIMPEFYQQYLQQKFPGEYIAPSEAFRKVQIGTDFPELVALLKQIEGYRGTGLTAKMYYEGKILEAVSLIMDRAKNNQEKKKKLHLTEQDQENLSAVADYLDNHYTFSVPIERLCRISFMGQTKLKATFKECFGCTLYDYILQKRIGQAQHLLMGTALSIAEIAQALGYDRPESFAKQFQRVTGLLPREYRKLINKE